VNRIQFYAGLLVTILAVLAFVDIGGDWTQDGWAELELWLAHPVLQLRSPGLTTFMKGLTALGSFPVLTVVVAVALAQPTARLGGRDKAVLLGLSVVQGLINGFLKSWFSRPRPDQDYSPLVEEHYFSFPSGHSMSSLCIYGFLAYLWVRRRPQRAGRSIALTTLVVLSIGITRVYLSAHYPGDVVGGFAAGWPCLFGAMCLHAGLKK
jgi:undecaprenyl-diphosphatase